jgi:hypothetical protein
MIALKASKRVQFADSFSTRFFSHYVTVALLSHALCEAVINAILAVGLTTAGSHALFPDLERKDLKEKWSVGPKSFSPSYRFDKGTSLFETLKELATRRNALGHSKIRLSVDGALVLEGSRFGRLAFHDGVAWMWRFFSLPYDLLEHANLHLRDVACYVFLNRSPILPSASAQKRRYSAD